MSDILSHVRSTKEPSGGYSEASGDAMEDSRDPNKADPAAGSPARVSEPEDLEVDIVDIGKREVLVGLAGITAAIAVGGFCWEYVRHRLKQKRTNEVIGHAADIVKALSEGSKHVSEALRHMHGEEVVEEVIDVSDEEYARLKARSMPSTTDERLQRLLEEKAVEKEVSSAVDANAS